MKNVLFQWKIYFIDIKNCQYDNDDVMSKYDNIKNSKNTELKWVSFIFIIIIITY